MLRGPRYPGQRELQEFGEPVQDCNHDHHDDQRDRSDRTPRFAPDAGDPMQEGSSSLGLCQQPQEGPPGHFHEQHHLDQEGTNAGSFTQHKKGQSGQIHELPEERIGLRFTSVQEGIISQSR